MINENNTRFFITMSKELESKVSDMAAEMGVTRGMLITMIVGQYVRQEGKLQNAVTDGINGVLARAVDEVIVVDNGDSDKFGNALVSSKT